VFGETKNGPGLKENPTYSNIQAKEI